MRKRSGIQLVAFVVACTFACTANAALREYFAADDLSIKEGQQLVVDGWDLEVHLRGADTDAVRCTTDLRISGTGADKADQWVSARVPQFKESEAGLQIALEASDDGFLGFARYMRHGRLGLVVPLGVIPDVTTSTGLITLRGDFRLADPIRLRTGTGNITFVGAAPSLEIRTTSGTSKVEVFRPLDRIWVRTSSGEINLAGGAKAVEIETASGDIILNGLSGSATVETVSGNMSVSWDRLPADAKIVLRTSKGDIRVTLPADASPGGRLTTATGEVFSEFPGEVSASGDTVQLTGDGPEIDVETASGTLVLAKDPGWFAPEK